MSARYMLGTATTVVTRWRANRGQRGRGLEAPHEDRGRADAAGQHQGRRERERMEERQDAEEHVSTDSKRKCSMQPAALARRFLCESMTPLGTPVVPEV